MMLQNKLCSRALINYYFRFLTTLPVQNLHSSQGFVTPGRYVKVMIKIYIKVFFCVIRLEMLEIDNLQRIFKEK